MTPLQQVPGRSKPADGSPPPANRLGRLWLDPLGRAAIRCLQLLVLIATTGAVLYALLSVKVVVLAVLIAIILASAVRPLVSWLERHGWRSTLAAATLFVGLLLLLGGVVTGVVLGIRNSLHNLTIAAKSGWRQLQDLLHGGPLPIPIDPDTVNAVLAQAGAYLQSAAARNSAVTGLSVASEALTGTVLMVGVPLVIPLSVVVFVTAFIPMVGAMIAGALAALVALVAKGPIAALIVIGIVFLVNHIEGYFLQPVVMGRTLSLHGLVVLLALSAGAILGGVAGAVLAVPLTAVGWAVLQVWTDRYQTGVDPILGPDPVSADEGLAERVSRAQRWKYALMRHQSHRRPTHATSTPGPSDHPGGKPASEAPAPDEQRPE